LLIRVQDKGAYTPFLKREWGFCFLGEVFLDSKGGWSRNENKKGMKE